MRLFEIPIHLSYYPTLAHRPPSHFPHARTLHGLLPRPLPPLARTAIARQALHDQDRPLVHIRVAGRGVGEIGRMQSTSSSSFWWSEVEHGTGSSWEQVTEMLMARCESPECLDDPPSCFEKDTCRVIWMSSVDIVYRAITARFDRKVFSCWIISLRRSVYF